MISIHIKIKEIIIILDDIFKISNKAIEVLCQHSNWSESEISIMKQRFFDIVKILLTGILGCTSTRVWLSVLGRREIIRVETENLSTTAMATILSSFFGP